MPQVTSADISKCSGAPCRAAASALIAYQKVLGPITQMHTCIHVHEGLGPDHPDAYIHTYIHAYTHTYIHTCMKVLGPITQMRYDPNPNPNLNNPNPKVLGPITQMRFDTLPCTYLRLTTDY